MPVVRRYGTRQVGTTPLPAAQRTAHETAISQGAGVAQARARAFGALADVGETAARLGVSVYGQIQADERQQADQMAIISAENQLATWERDRLYDPEHGALQVRGRAAVPLRQQIDDEFERQAAAIAATLNTPAQRVAFTRVRNRYKDNVDGTIERHVAQEVRTYDLAELKARVDNGVDLAITNAQDTRRVKQEIAGAAAAIETVGPRYGMGPEALQQEIANLQSRAVVGIIDRLLANDQVARAQDYYHEGRHLIAGDQLARVERALEEGGLRQRGQQESDRILSAGGTLTQWREQARAIEDPQLRDEVLQRVEHEASIRERQDRDVDEGRLRRAADVIDRTRDVRQVPPGDWAAFSPGQRSALRSYAKQLVDQNDVETDLPTYYRLMSKAADDPEAFARENLLDQVHKLGRVEFKELAGLQRSIRDGDRKATEKDLAGFRTKDQIVKDTLVQYGVDPEPKTDTATGKAAAASIAQLRRMLDLRIDAAQAEGVKVTNVEIQGTLDDLLSAQMPGVKSSWWSFLPGGAPFFDQPGKRYIDLRVDDIPVQDRADLERALRAKGRPVSDATVRDLYVEVLMRRRAR